MQYLLMHYFCLYVDVKLQLLTGHKIFNFLFALKTCACYLILVAHCMKDEL